MEHLKDGLIAEFRRLPQGVIDRATKEWRVREMVAVLSTNCRPNCRSMCITSITIILKTLA